MKRNILLTLVAAMLIGADAAKEDSAAKDVEKGINSLNTAFQNRDADEIRRLMTDEHVSVTTYYGVPQSKNAQIENLPNLKLTEYTPEKLHVALLDKDVALVTYSLTQKGTFKGKEVPPKSFASAVWVNRGGKWLEIFYQETPLEGQ